MASAESSHLLDNLLLFGRLLRRLGLDVHTGRMLDAVSVLEDIGVRRKADVRAASEDASGAPQGRPPGV